MLTWTEAISTGVDAIDKEHQMLFGKFNELEEALSSRSMDKAGEILGFLWFYSDLHFTEEEREIYKERNAQIAREMLFVMSLVR